LSHGENEWYGEPHTLTVHSVTPPDSPFDDGEIESELEHPPTCKQEERTFLGGGGNGMLIYTCAVAEMEAEFGLLWCLKYSGTPITEPGVYRIQSWGNKTYHHEYGYEYDAGIAVMEPEQAVPDAS
jgi:hypothetical protein